MPLRLVARLNVELRFVLVRGQFARLQPWLALGLIALQRLFQRLSYLQQVVQLLTELPPVVPLRLVARLNAGLRFALVLEQYARLQP